MYVEIHAINIPALLWYRVYKLLNFFVWIDTPFFLRSLSRLNVKNFLDAFFSSSSLSVSKCRKHHWINMSSFLPFNRKPSWIRFTSVSFLFIAYLLCFFFCLLSREWQNNRTDCEWLNRIRLLDGLIKWLWANDRWPLWPLTHQPIIIKTNIDFKNNEPLNRSRQRR